MYLNIVYLLNKRFFFDITIFTFVFSVNCISAYPGGDKRNIIIKISKILYKVKTCSV